MPVPLEKFQLASKFLMHTSSGQSIGNGYVYGKDAIRARRKRAAKLKKAGCKHWIGRSYL